MRIVNEKFNFESPSKKNNGFLIKIQIRLGFFNVKRKTDFSLKTPIFMKEKQIWLVIYKKTVRLFLKKCRSDFLFKNRLDFYLESYR